MSMALQPQRLSGHKHTIGTDEISAYHIQDEKIYLTDKNCLNKSILTHSRKL